MEAFTYYPAVRDLNNRAGTTRLTIISCSIAVTRLLQPVLERNGLPGAVASLVCGGVDVGKEVVGSHDVDLSTVQTGQN
jgi:hypothetical protein